MNTFGSCAARMATYTHLESPIGLNGDPDTSCVQLKEPAERRLIIGVKDDEAK